MCGIKQPRTCILLGLSAILFSGWGTSPSGHAGSAPPCTQAAQQREFTCPTKHVKPRRARCDHHPRQESHLKGVWPRWIISVADASGQQNILPGFRDDDEVADVPSLVPQQVCPDHLYKGCSREHWCLLVNQGSMMGRGEVAQGENSCGSFVHTRGLLRH